jgi:hypothetical protein
LILERGVCRQQILDPRFGKAVLQRRIGLHAR